MSKVEYDEVTVKVPRVIMDYLRKRYGDAKSWLEQDIVASVKADVDFVVRDLTTVELSKLLGLEQIFKDC